VARSCFGEAQDFIGFSYGFRPGRSQHDALDALNVGLIRLVAWYNTEHRHSAIRYVTPDERHFGAETEVLAARAKLYEYARAANPERWSRVTRNWSPVGVVVLNPQPSATQEAA